MLAYLALIRRHFQERKEFASVSRAEGISDDFHEPPSILELMRELYQTTEAILISKKHLFCPKLRESCVALLLEMYEDLPQSSIPHDWGRRRVATESIVMEWCISQCWGTLQSKKSRVSKSLSRSCDVIFQPLSSGSSTINSSTVSIGMSPHSISDSVDSVSDPCSQSKKRSPSESVLANDGLAGRANKKQRAIAKIRELFPRLVAPIESPNLSPKTPSPVIPPRYPFSKTQHLLQMIPHSVERRKLSPSSVFLGNGGSPRGAINMKIPHSATSLAVNGIDGTTPTPPTSFSLKSPPYSPPVPIPILTVTAPPSRAKDKKRKAILKLREIFYLENLNKGDSY